MTDITKNFGRRLKEIRKAKGLTQSQLAELSNIEVMSISRIENGTHFPKKENIESFAKVLKVEVKDLFDYKTNTTKKELIEDINAILKNSNIPDLKFFKNILYNYCETKSNNYN